MEECIAMPHKPHRELRFVSVHLCQDLLERSWCVQPILVGSPLTAFAIYFENIDDTTLMPKVSNYLLLVGLWWKPSDVVVDIIWIFLYEDSQDCTFHRCNTQSDWHQMCESHISTRSCHV